MKNNLYLFFTLLVPVISYSQSFQDQNVNRSEYTFAIGPSNAMTDLGGSAIDGTHFLRDYNFHATRYAGYFGYRKKISRSFSLKGVLTGGMLYANDDLSGNPYRYNRNQDFRSIIIEPSLQLEYHLFKPKKVSHTDSVEKELNDDDQNNPPKRPSHWDVYIFGGIGGFYFNPQGKYNPGGPPPPPGMNTDEWYNLRPLSTEGEGLPGGPPAYSPFALCVPIGIGVKYGLNSNWSIGFELSDRLWTSTDYLDDTRGNYFNPNEISQYKGGIAAYFSNPVRGLIADQDLAGQERGNQKSNDTYMFLFFCVNYHPSFNFHHNLKFNSNRFKTKSGGRTRRRTKFY